MLIYVKNISKNTRNSYEFPVFYLPIQPMSLFKDEEHSCQISSQSDLKRWSLRVDTRSRKTENCRLL